MTRFGLITCLFICLLYGISVGSVFAEDSLRVVGVQLEISPGLYANEETFSEHAAQLIEEVLREGDADLVIFPEYSGVFFAFFDMGIDKLEGKSLTAGLEYLRKSRGTASLKEFFLSYPAEATMKRIWGGLSRRFGLAILGGTCFAFEDGAEGKELRNRALLYDEDGELLYRQDKVFLTPFEKDIVGINPGSLTAARSFSIRGRKLGISICRDTFFPAWEKVFSDVDLWIDIKANGEVFDARQRDIFRRALPERLENLTDTLGMTVCLNGDFLDLLWEGPVQRYSGGLYAGAACSSVSGQGGVCAGGVCCQDCCSLKRNRSLYPRQLDNASII